MPASVVRQLPLHLLGAGIALPLLVAEHSPPFPGYRAEWLSIVLGLAAALALVFQERTPLRVPRSTLLPAVLVGILILQVAAGKLAYVETALLGMLYLAWAALLMCVAASLSRRFGILDTAGILAGWLMTGALAGTLAAVLSSAGLEAAWLIPQPTAPLLHGNVGQRNHFAVQLWLGIASALFLADRGKLPSIALVVALAVLLPAAALTGSRATLLYAIWAAVAVYGWRPSGATWRIALPAGAAAVAYVLIVVLLPLAGIDVRQLAAGRIASDYAEFVDRFGSGERSGIDVRWSMLVIGWKMFLASPWLGSGFGTYPWASFAAATDSSWQGGGEHAHNLFAQLLGETGLFAAAACAFLLVRWWLRLSRRHATPAHSWIAATAGILLIHAQVEYPFWYAYFLGLFAVVLALGDDDGVLQLRTRIVVLATVAGLAVAVVQLADYRHFQSLIEQARRQGSIPNHRALLELRQASLLKPEIDLLYAATLLPTRERLSDKRVVCESSLRYQPSNPTVYSCAALAALAGDESRAAELWRLAERVAPGGGAAYRARIEKELPADDLAALQPWLQGLANKVADKPGQPQ